MGGNVVVEKLQTLMEKTVESYRVAVFHEKSEYEGTAWIFQRKKLGPANGEEERHSPGM